MSSPQPQSPELDFAIIGAQKSASTYLQVCLATHPQIDMPDGESRHFEDPYFEAGAVAELPALFGPRVDGVRRGIKRPDYLARPPVAGRLAEANPDLRLLVVLREPVTRAVSAYFDYVRLGFAPVLPVDEAIAAILDRTLQQRYPRVADVLDFGLYGRHLTRYLDHFPRAQLLVLLHEDVVAEPDRQLGRACEFLGVDASFRSPKQDNRPNTSVYSARRLRLLRSRNRKLFSYAPDLSRREPRTPTLTGRAWSAAVTALDRVVLARLDRPGAPRLSPPLDRRLRDYYRDDVAVVERLLSRRLPIWTSGS